MSTSTLCSAINAGVAQGHGLAVHPADDALAGDRLKIARFAEPQPLRLGAADDGRGQRMFAAALQAGGQAQHFIGVEAGGRFDRRPVAACLRSSVPVLSTTSVSAFCSVSSASAFLMSTPFSAPLPVPTMIAIGVARPRAQGQAMMSTATALTSAWASRGSGPAALQTMKVSTAIASTAGTK